MNSQETETFVQRYMQIWSAGNAQLVDAVAAPNITVSYTHFPTPIQGVKQFKEILAQTHNSFPDLQLTVDETLCTNDIAAVRWHYAGTHQQGEVFGAAPRGQSVKVDGITFLHISDSKVIREQGIVDNFSLQHQLKGEP